MSSMISRWCQAGITLADVLMNRYVDGGFYEQLAKNQSGRPRSAQRRGSYSLVQGTATQQTRRHFASLATFGFELDA
jgi:hypothetical protein